MGRWKCTSVRHRLASMHPRGVSLPASDESLSLFGLLAKHQEFKAHRTTGGALLIAPLASGGQALRKNACHAGHPAHGIAAEHCCRSSNRLPGPRRKLQPFGRISIASLGDPGGE